MEKKFITTTTATDLNSKTCLKHCFFLFVKNKEKQEESARERALCQLTEYF